MAAVTARDAAFFPSQPTAIDEHLHECFREPGLISFANGSEHHEVRQPRFQHQLVANIALRFAQRERHVISANR
jgi:hypothetical protein